MVRVSGLEEDVKEREGGKIYKDGGKNRRAGERSMQGREEEGIF